MIAQEMFEALEYNSITNKNDNKICYKFETRYFFEIYQFIIFDLNTKTYSIISSSDDGNNRNAEIGIELHLAIHQQMKELGWLDET